VEDWEDVGEVEVRVEEWEVEAMLSMCFNTVDMKDILGEGKRSDKRREVS